MLAFDVHPDQDLKDISDRPGIKIQFGCKIDSSIENDMILFRVQNTSPAFLFQLENSTCKVGAFCDQFYDTSIEFFDPFPDI